MGSSHVSLFSFGFFLLEIYRSCSVEVISKENLKNEVLIKKSVPEGY